jgi:hypothetical protein
MSNSIKKHTDVVDSIERFNENYKNGIYVEPWVVYIKSDSGYTIQYSNYEKRDIVETDINYINLLTQRIDNLETEKVYCTESQYDELVENPNKEVTISNIRNGEIVSENHIFDINKMYCIYEDEE